jgi:hypothetical protein
MILHFLLKHFQFQNFITLQLVFIKHPVEIITINRKTFVEVQEYQKPNQTKDKVVHLIVCHLFSRWHVLILQIPVLEPYPEYPKSNEQTYLLLVETNDLSAV